MTPDSLRVVRATATSLTLLVRGVSLYLLEWAPADPTHSGGGATGAWAQFAGGVIVDVDGLTIGAVRISLEAEDAEALRAVLDGRMELPVVPPNPWRQVDGAVHRPYDEVYQPIARLWAAQQVTA